MIKGLLKSIRFRLVAVSVVIFGLTTAGLAFVLLRGIQQTQQSAFDTALFNYSVDLARSIDLNFLGELIVRRDVGAAEGKIFPFPMGQSVVQVRTLDGRVVLSSANMRDRPLPLVPAWIKEALRSGATFTTIGIRSKSYRLVLYPIREESLPPLILQVAAPTTVIEAERERLTPLLWITITIALAAAAVVGLIVSTRALLPVDRIIESAKSIKASQLGARVPVPEQTEFRELALTLNGLLERLQKAFESQSHFIADASHQLKTPLAIIRGELDVFVSGEKKPEESEELLVSLSQEVSQLSKTVDDLLLLAQFDSEVVQVSFHKVRIDEVLLDVISSLGKAAKRAGVDIEFEATGSEETGAFEVRGDFDLLRILFFNLVENAIKYSSRPGRVKVRIDSHEGKSRVSIVDSGLGIPEQERSRIFDRFFRGIQAEGHLPGAGLGLSIASRIARLHEAQLLLESSPGQGAQFCVEIKEF